jgi:curved DNA-binding protein CbpA
VPIDDEVDLDPARQQEILELEAKLETASFFELLGVPAGAPVEVVKAAFRDASRKFHPDKYFGRKLGSFKGRLEKVFKRLVEAHQTLSDPDRRRSYLDAHPGLQSSADKSRSTPPAPIELSRDAERRARLARHPYLLKTSRVQSQLARAKEAIGRKEYSQAFTFLNQASQGDPQNLEVKTLLAEVRKLNDVQRAETSFVHGKEALDRGDDALAIQAFKLAASGGHPAAAAKVANLLERRRGDLREITGYAQRAVELEPTNVEYRILLSRLLDQAGMRALAKKHFEEALRLDPEHPEVKKHVKKRWPF